ncbi:MAG: potassium/proton antiporter, partial [Ruminiclostridium sp.]|nr:potassium/proton antiporter [Ruminiclostridium sp.]
EQICTVCLIFIMFCGGFSANWKAAKPVALRAGLLSSFGTIITALITTAGCYFLIGFDIKESFLIGAVISSTDAASVFSILRSKQLNLRGGLASLLEIESGSNDPFSYMLTVIALAVMGSKDLSSIGLLAVLQTVVGVLFGFGIGFAAVFVFNKVKLSRNSFDIVFMISVISAAYAAPILLSGNGYLSVYIAGIIIGNSKIGENKAQLVHFFDGITGLSQIMLFFLLGLLSNPSQLPGILLPALAIFAIMTFISRPAAVFAICSVGYTWRDRLFIAWSGLRGASSIAFAIMALVSDFYSNNNLFNIVLCVCLISVAFQGTLLPKAATKLGLIDNDSSVLKTFNDYQDETEQFNMMRIFVSDSHSWCGHKICDISLPEDSLVLMVKHGDETIVPKGNTVINAGDDVILSVPSYHDSGDIKLKEYEIGPKHLWRNKTIKELNLPATLLIIIIKGSGDIIVPYGSTRINQGDILVVSDQSHNEKEVKCEQRNNTEKSDNEEINTDEEIYASIGKE